MSRRERRKWTSQEDALLREAVSKATSQDAKPLQWQELAKSVPGRTNKDCRRRWCNTIASGVTKGPWTETEDERLAHAVHKHGPKWTRVAAAVGTRTSDQCSSHWNQTLNPHINVSDWTPEEDESLIKAVQRHGTNWSKLIDKCAPNRSSLALKNRYVALRTQADRAHALTNSSADKQTLEPTTKVKPVGTKHNLDSRDNGRRGTATPNSDTDDDGDVDDENEDEDESSSEDERMTKQTEGHDGGNRPRQEPKNYPFPAGNMFEMNWETSFPTNSSASTSGGPSSYGAYASPSVYSSAYSSNQLSTDPTSTSTEQWPKDIYTDTNALSNMLSPDYGDNGSHKATAQSMNLPTVGSPKTIQKMQQRDVHGHVPPPPASSPTQWGPDVAANSIDFTTQNELTNWLDENAKSSSPSGSIGLPTQSAKLNKSFSRAGKPTHGISESQDPSRTHSVDHQTRVASSNAQSLSRSANEGEELRQVSIDALCTPEQLTNIVGHIAGRAKKMTVKLGPQ